MKLPHRLLSKLLLTLSFCALATDAGGQSEPELLTVGSQRRSAKFVSSDAEGKLQFQTPQGVTIVAAPSELIRWAHPVSARSPEELHLVDGSRIVGARAWDGATAIGVAKARGSAQTNLLGEIKFDRSQVRAIFWSLPPDDSRRQQLQNDLDDARSTGDDVLVLANSDSFTGTFVGNASNNIPSDESDAAPVVLFDSAHGRIAPLVSSIRGVALTPTAAVPPEKPSAGRPKLLVGLRDGSLIAAQSIVADDQQLVINSAALGDLRGGNARDVVFLQSLSEHIAYLSDWEPTGYRHAPYLELTWPYQCDLNLTGSPLRSVARRYVKGVAMHSAARLTYKLVPGEYRRFAAEVAVDDSVGNRGSVVFRVYLKLADHWQVAYASSVIRGGSPPVEASAELSGATEISLVVDYADRGDELDHANWLDARLEK